MRNVLMPVPALGLAAAPAASTAAPGGAPPEVAATKKSCDKGNAADCHKLAWIYARGEGVPKDLSKAASLLKKSCEQPRAGLSRPRLDAPRWGGRLEGPHEDGRLLRAGLRRRQRRGLRAARPHLRRGQGGAEGPRPAAEFLQKGCDGGVARSCGALGSMYEEGGRVSKDLARAAELYGKACEGGETRPSVP